MKRSIVTLIALLAIGCAGCKPCHGQGWLSDQWDNEAGVKQHSKSMENALSGPILLAQADVKDLPDATAEAEWKRFIVDRCFNYPNTWAGFLSAVYSCVTGASEKLTIPERLQSIRASVEGSQDRKVISEIREKAASLKDEKLKTDIISTLPIKAGLIEAIEANPAERIIR